VKKYFILTLMLFFISVSEVSAYPINDVCVEDGTCMVVCNYVNYKNRTTNNKDTTLDRNLSIYYYFNTNEFKVSWETLVNKIVKTKKGSMGYVFSESGTPIYWGINESYTVSNFVCPKYGFIDMDNAWDSNELCFDNDGNTCSTKYSGFATSFGIVADYSSFASHEKNYDFENELANYLNNDFEEILNGINKGTFNIKTDLQTRLEKDFTNYLHGNSMPPFMINSPAYTNFETNLLERYEKRKEEELKKAEEEKEDQIKAAENKKKKELEELDRDLLKGVITQEEYNQRVAEIEREHEETKSEIENEYKDVEENWNNTPEEVRSQVNSVFNSFKSNVQIDFKTGACDSYLGDPKENGSPAYYLQFVFNLMKYVAIILLLVLTIVDYAKAVASSNQDAIKKATTNTIKRIIIAAVIFILPMLIEFLFRVLGLYNSTTCGIK